MENQMKKNSLTLTMILATVSTSTLAKVTEADLARDTRWLAQQHTDAISQEALFQKWETENKPPENSEQKERQRNWYNTSYGTNHTYGNSTGHEVIVRARGGQHTWYTNRCSLVLWVNGIEVDSSKIILNDGSTTPECAVSGTVPKNGNFRFGYRHTVGGSGAPRMHTAIYR